MSKNKLSIVKEILGEPQRSGSEYLFFCLFCKHHKKKLSLNLDKGKYKCWICDAAGPISRLVKRHGTFSQQQAWREITGQVEVSDFEKLFLNSQEQKVEEEQIIHLPDEFISLCNMNTSLTSVQAKNYLLKRGIEKADILRWKLGYCQTGDYAERIIAPSFNLDGKCNYFVGRTYTRHWKKYMNPPEGRDIIFNELYVDWDDDIVLCEGVFDALSISGLAVLHNTISDSQARLIRSIGKEITVVPDQDTAGVALIDRALELGWPVSIPNWPTYIKDVNDAVRHYGRVATLWMIVNNKLSTDLKIKLRMKNWIKDENTN